MQAIDLLIRARWIVPIEPDARVLEGHALAIHNGRILALEPEDTALQRYVPAVLIDRPRHALLPGLVDAHAQTGSGPLPSGSAARVDPSAQRDVMEVAICDRLRTGTTCFAELAPWPDVAARTAAERRVRACIGLPVTGASSGWAVTPDEHIERGMRLRDEYRGDPLISTRLAAPSLDRLEEPMWRRVRRLADELEIAVAMPVHSGTDQASSRVAAHSTRPLAQLEQLGLLNPLLVALHLLDCSDAELDLLASSSASVVACPSADLRAGRGMAPLPRLLGRAIRTAFGSGSSDGAAPGLAGGPLDESRLAMLLASGLPGQLVAGDMLRMVTLEGARVLGLGEQIGSLVPGKWADLCCVEWRHPERWERTEVVEALVGGGRQHAVSDAWIAGRPVLSEGLIVGCDESELHERLAIARSASHASPPATET